MRVTPSSKNYAIFDKGLRRAAGVAQNASILFGISSIILGPVLVLSFMGKVSSVWGLAPVGAAELYGAALIPTIFFVASVLFLYIVVLVVFNGLIRNSMEGWLRSGFPLTYQRWLDDRRRTASSPIHPRDLGSYFVLWLSEYAILHAPSLLVMLTLCFEPKSIFSLVLSFLLGIYLVFFWILAKEKTVSRRGFPRRTMRATSAALMINVVAFGAWCISIFVLSKIYAATYTNTDLITNFEMYAVVASIIFIDFIFYSRRSRVPQSILYIAFLFLSLVFLLQPSIVGMMAFRALGFGGGMPVTILVKSNDNDGKFYLSQLKGCLVSRA